MIDPCATYLRDVLSLLVSLLVSLLLSLLVYHVPHTCATFSLPSRLNWRFAAVSAASCSKTHGSII